MYKALFSCLALIFLVSCAEKPDGIIVMNEETIENFFEKDKLSWNPPAHLNLLIDQPVTEAQLPPVPQGLVRIAGTLSSDGSYTYNGDNTSIRSRGSSFSESVFAQLGPAGKGGNAWFYADFNPDTGEIADARAYLYGFMGGVCDMRDATSGSYGQMDRDSFTLNINGPCLFPEVPGATMDFALLIKGASASMNAQNFQLRYIVDDTGMLLEIPASPRQSAAIFDAGNGRAWLD